MKTIPELLSGDHDEELRVLVAEARGWKLSNEFQGAGRWNWQGPDKILRGYFDYNRDKTPTLLDSLAFGNPVPPYPTSLDATRELLADLTEEEKLGLCGELMYFEAKFGKDRGTHIALLCATARQICVAYLIVKRVIK